MVSALDVWTESPGGQEKKCGQEVAAGAPEGAVGGRTAQEDQDGSPEESSVLVTRAWAL